MHQITLQWKNFNIDLDAVDSKLRTDYPSLYSGNQAHLVLELWFTEDPGAQALTDIQSWWDGLTDQSSEATSYRSQSAIQAAMQTLREGVPDKTWNQLISVERKLQMGLSVTKADLIAAGVL